MNRRSKLLTVTAILGALLVVGSTGAVTQSPAAGGSPGSDTGSASIIAWNEIALGAAVGTAKQPPPQAIVTIALVQAAVYDAVVAIKGGYQPYLAGLESGARRVRRRGGGGSSPRRAGALPARSVGRPRHGVRGRSRRGRGW